MFSSMEKWQPHVLMRNAILRASFDYRCAKKPRNRVSGFFYHRSKVLNLYTANLTATMGRYGNSGVCVCLFQSESNLSIIRDPAFIRISLCYPRDPSTMIENIFERIFRYLYAVFLVAKLNYIVNSSRNSLWNSYSR